MNSNANLQRVWTHCVYVLIFSGYKIQIFLRRPWNLKKISHHISQVLNNLKIIGRLFQNCGLLKISELYKHNKSCKSWWVDHNFTSISSLDWFYAVITVIFFYIFIKNWSIQRLFLSSFQGFCSTYIVACTCLKFWSESKSH